MKIKTILCLLLVSVMLLTLFGCGKQNTETTTEKTTAEGTTAEGTTTTKEVVKLKLLTHEGNVNVKPSNDLIIYKELQKLTGVEIIWETVPETNLNEVITTRFAAGVDLPDICNLFWNLGTAATVQGLRFYNDGLITDLTNLVEQYAPGLKKFYAENEVAKANGTYDGKILSFPEGDRFDNAYSVGLMLNKPWMDELGLKEPASVDDLYELLKAFKAADKDSLPLAGMWNMEKYLRNPFGDEWQHTAEDYSYIVDANGKVDAFVRTSGYKDYLAYMNKLFKEGLFEQNDKVGELATKEKNKLGAFCLFTGYGSMITNEVIDPTKQTVTFIPAKPLTGPGKPKAYNYKVLPVGKSGGFGFVVTKACKNPEAAVKWLDMVSFDENCLNLLYYGIEGTHYKVEDGKKVLIDQQLLYKDGGAETSIPARQFVEIFDMGRPKFAEYDKANMRPFHISGSFPYPNLNIAETESYGKYITDVGTYLNEETSKFIKGKRSLDEFGDFVKQLNKLGLEEMVKIQQGAYDNFKSK